MRSERGVSIVEMVVAMALLTVISLIFYSSYVGSLRAGQFLESHGDLEQFGQHVVNQLKAEIIQSRYMFQDDANGRAYMSAIQLPSGVAAESGTRLPLTDVNGTIRPDAAGETRVGNSLMLARQLSPVEVSVDLNGDGTADATRYLADRYQLELVFLDRVTGRPFANLDYYLDLVMGTSEVFADHFQLSGLDATASRQVAAALYAQGVRRAWDPARAVDQAIFTIAADGTLAGPVADPRIPLTTESLVPAFAGGRISGAMSYSVGATTSPPLATPEPVALFGQTSGSFPGGFEVLAVGSAGARKIMVRLVLLSHFDRRIVSRVSTVTATAIQM